jgi:1,2-diacylglycerol 3-beta-galactosyltransferase
MQSNDVLEKYLFLYLKTGGGHLAPAKAVANKIMSKRRNKVDIELTDGLTGTNLPLKKILEDGYDYSVNNVKWVFEFLYFINKLTAVAKLTSVITGYFMEPSLRRLVLSLEPKKIVVFHFFLIRPVYRILRKLNLDIPVITVVTDPFTAHPIWFLQKGQNFIVFSELLKEKCIEKGIDKNALKVFPFVMDSKFSRRIGTIKQERIRKNLGFSQNSRIILILGGGQGMPKGKNILKRIIKSNMEAEIAIVCGNNTKLYSDAHKIRVRYGFENLKIYGYVDFVHSLISISDIVVTKCGASTSMEILLLGKVPVINNYIWEQEKGNMEFVCSNKFGVLEKDTHSLPGILNKLLKERDFYNLLVENINNAMLSNGVSKVSDYILKFR